MSYINRTLEFHKIYKEQILPILRYYEVYRRRELTKQLIYLGILLLMNFLPQIYISLNSYLSFKDTWLFICAIIVIISSGIIFLYFINLPKKSKSFATTVKKHCLKKILQVFEDIQWYNCSTISNDTIMRSGLFIDYNTREDDDRFYGKHNGVPFKIIETHLWYQGDKQNDFSIGEFKGVIIEFENNKFTTNRTIIQTKGTLTAKQEPFFGIFVLSLFFIPTLILYFYNISFSVGIQSVGYVLLASILILLFPYAIIKHLNARNNEEQLNKVTLEDVTFNKRFDVYSSDQTEARYMITTAFMERFYNIKTAFKAKNIKCSFIENKLIVAFQTNKDLFEFGSLFKSLESPKAINELYNELSSILQMVEYFKLDEKTRL